MDGKILETYARIDPRGWKDIEEFAVAGFVRETGLPEKFLQPMPPDEADKLRPLVDLLEKTDGTERGNRIRSYMCAHGGARYLASIAYPFPKPGIISSAAPLAKAIEVGTAIIPIKGAIMGLANPANVTWMSSDPRFLDSNYSLEALKTHARRLKEILPDTRTETVMHLMSLHGSLRPELKRQITSVLDGMFGGKTALTEPAAPRGPAN